MFKTVNFVVVLALAPRVSIAASVSGRVVDVSGRPVPTAIVTVAVMATGEEAIRTPTTPDGSFHLELPPDLPPSEIRVSAVRCRTLAVDNIGLPSGKVDLGVLTLPPASMVHGHVQDESGHAIAEAVVTLQSLDGHSEWLPGRGITDAGGDYVIDAAPQQFGTTTVQALGFVTGVSAGYRGLWTLRRGGVIRGRVTDERGEPVERAVVTVGDHAVFSDAHGRYHIGGASGSVRIQAADSLGRVETQDVLAIDNEIVPVALVLLPGAVLSGVVKEQAGGGPIAGAVVRLRQGSRMSFSSDQWLTTVSAADGTFHFNGLFDGQYIIDTRRAGYLTVVRPGVAIQRERTSTVPIALASECRIEGRVVDEGANPMPRALITAVDPRPLQQMARTLRAARREPDSTWTDAQGRFVLHGVAPGTSVRIEAVADGYVESQREIEAASGMTVSEINFVLRRGLTASGLVVDRNQQPIANVEVRLQRLEEGASMPLVEPFPRKPPVVAETGRDGRYWLTGLKTSRYALLFTARGYSASLVRTAIGPDASSVLPTATLAPMASISGRLTTEAGAPLAGATVSLLHPANGVRTVLTSVTGDFAFDNLTEGQEVSLQFAADRMASTTREVRAPAIGLAIALSPGASLRGRVLSADSGRPVHDFSVERIVRVPGRTTIHLGGSAGKTFHDVDGSFELRQIPPEPCVLRVRANGYQTAETIVAHVPSSDDIVVRLDPGLSLEGQVVTADTHQPLVNASVVWQAGNFALQDEALALFLGLAIGDDSTMTDSEGRFTLDDLPPGQVTLFASHPDRASGRVHVTLPARQPVEVRLGGGAELAGIARLRDGAAASGIHIGLGATDDPMGTFGNQTTTSDADGRFVFRHLTAGSYVVGARGQTEASRSNPIVLRDGEHRDDVTLVLSNGSRILGSVVGLAPGALGHVFVMAHGVGYNDSTTTDDAGRFEFAHVPSGIVGLEATSSFIDGTSVTKRLDLTDADGSEVDVMLEFSGQSGLRGIVSRSGIPVAGLSVAVMPSTAECTTRGRSQTREDGSFDITGLDPSQYILTISGPSGRYQRPVAVSGLERIDVDLPASSLSGTVTSVGKPVAGVTVAVVSGRELHSIDIKTAKTDSTGRYEITDLDPGMYQARFTKDGYKQQARAMTIQSIEELDVELEAAAGSPVHVFDGDSGEPLMRVHFLITGDGGVVFDGTIVLDRSGRGTLPAFPPRDYLLIVSASGHASRSAYLALPAPADIALEKGERVDIRLPAGAATRARLVDGNGLSQFVAGTTLNGWTEIIGPLTTWPNVPVGLYRFEREGTTATREVRVVKGAPTVVTFQDR